MERSEVSLAPHDPPDERETIRRLRHLADVVERAEHVPAITDTTPVSEPTRIDGFSMARYVQTTGTVLDTECSTVCCLGGYACSIWGDPCRPHLWNGSRASEALGLKSHRLGDVLFVPRCLRADDPEFLLANISPARAARACRRLANLLENEPESVQPLGREDWHGFEQRLTEALWGDEEDGGPPSVARFDGQGVHAFPDGSPFGPRCGRHRNRIGS